MYSVPENCVYSVDPDEMPHYLAFHLGLISSSGTLERNRKMIFVFLN